MTITTSPTALRNSVRDARSVVIPVLARRSGGLLERVELRVQGINGCLYRVHGDGMAAEMDATGTDTVTGWGRHYDGEVVEFDGRYLVSRRIVSGLALNA